MSGNIASRADEDGINAIRGGDRNAFNEQVGQWVYRIYDVALSILGSTAAAIEASRDTIESLWDRHHNLSADDLTRDSLLIAARERALALRRPDDGQEISTTNEHVVVARAAAVVLGVEEVSYLDLYLRHAVDADALGPVLGVASTAVAHRLALSRADLGETMAAYSLWNEGRPTCVELATSLGDTTVFDTTVAESIERHRQQCSECARRHRSVVNPERLFSAAPVVAVSPVIRERIVAIATPTTEVTGGGATAIHPQHLASSVDHSVAELDDVWAPTIRSTPTPMVAPVVPGGRSGQRWATALVAAAVALLVVGGVVALAARGSAGNPRKVSSASVPANQLDPADLRDDATTTTTTTTAARPRTTTMTSSTAATTTSTTTTLTVAPTSSTDVVLAAPPVLPTTTTRPRSATTSPVSPTSPSTPAPTTTSPTTTAPTTTAPTTSTDAPTTTTASPTSTPTTTDAPTTTATTTATTTTTIEESTTTTEATTTTIAQ